MKTKRVFSGSDCEETDRNSSLVGKIVVLTPDHENQLYFCLCGNGAGENAAGKILFLISLHTGAFVLKTRADLIGILKPELLPESAKLQLAKVRPMGALSLESNTPQYFTQVFTPAGGHDTGVSLCTMPEVWDYIKMQTPYQYRVTISDRSDRCILELLHGEISYPADMEQELFQKHSQ